MPKTDLKGKKEKASGHSAEEMAVNKSETLTDDAVETVDSDCPTVDSAGPDIAEYNLQKSTGTIFHASGRGKIDNRSDDILGLSASDMSYEEEKAVALRKHSIQKQIDGSVMDTMKNFFESGEFADSVRKYALYGRRSTGFTQLDSMLRLVPSLIFLGGASSVGKTTLLAQIADNLAVQGEYVLYFSLEQTRFELFSKALSRTLSKLADTDPALNRYTAMEFREGKVPKGEVKVAVDAYLSKVEDRLTVIECNFSMSAEAIENTIYDFMVKHPNDKSPVVIIDYLQILAPSFQDDGRITSEMRASLEKAIHSLKAFQINHQLTMFVASSLNRCNYKNPIDFESFKETGAIEYTGDTVIGIQPSIITKPEFEIVEETDKDGKTKKRARTVTEKNQLLADEKNKLVRDVQLVILKNRNGRPYTDVEFEYNTMYDMFVEASQPPFSGNSGGGGYKNIKGGEANT